MELGEVTVKVFTVKKLAELLRCSSSTVLLYLGRGEFSHVQVVKFKRSVFYKGVTLKDLERLRELLDSRRYGSAKRVHKTRSCTCL